MNIIFKFIFKNIKEKKMRTFLIVFSITISTALFFASSAITDSLTKMYIDQIKKSYGQSELVVQAGKKSPTKYFTIAIPSEYGKRIDYSVGVFNGIGIFKYKRDGAKDENVTINLKGIEWKDIQRMTPVTLAQESDLDPFKGKKIVLSKKTADKYGLDIGEVFELEIEGAKYKFTICGIAQMAGPFSDDGQTHQAVVSRDTLSTIYGQKGNVSTLYIKLKDPLDKQFVLNGMTEQLKRFTVKETVSKADLQEQTANVVVALGMALVMVLFMSVFIIYSSFKVITTERLPIIGTFRSVGASRRVTDFVLLSESIIYGAIGGIIGCGLGIGVLYLIAKATTPVWDPSYKTSIQFGAVQLTIAFTVAVVLSLISSLIPILKVSRIPVKDIVLNKIEGKTKRKGKGLWKPILGIIFLLAVFIIPPISSGDAGMAIDSLCILLGVAGVVLLIPYFTWGFVKIFEKLYVYVFGNEGVLAVKNLRNNKSILNNISLLAIGISSLLAINTVSRSSINEIINYFDTCFKYDISFSMPNMDRSFETVIRGVEGVKEAKGFYMTGGIEVKGTDKIIGVLEGADNSTYMDFVDIVLDGGKEFTQKKLDELNEGRNIIITGMLRNRLGVTAGDTLTLRMPAGDRDYKVIAVWDSMNYGGSFAAVGEKFLKMDMKMKYYNSINIKTDKNPEEMLKFLKDKYARNEAGGITIDEIKGIIVKSNSQMFGVLNAFSILTVLIGIFGVFNNLIISFIERKRSLAVLRSVGMNKRQIVKMIFVESLTGGLIGGIVGVIGGLLQISVMYYIIKILVSSIPMHFTASLLINSLLAGAVITLAASISPALKSSKLNIIESIKYE